MCIHSKRFMSIKMAMLLLQAIGIYQLLTGKVVRLLLNYQLQYKHGVRHANADGMSRLPIKDVYEEGAHLCNTIFMVDLDHSPVTAAEVRLGTERDPTLSRVIKFVLQGWPENFDVDEEFRPFKQKTDEMSVERGCLLWGS